MPGLLAEPHAVLRDADKRRGHGDARDLRHGDGRAGDVALAGRRLFGRRRGKLRSPDGGRVAGGGGRRASDHDDVLLAQGVLVDAAVELDDLLDGVEVGHVDPEGRLDGQEGHALGARGRGERARVLEDVGRGEVGEHAGEVDASLDGRLAAGLLDGFEVRGDAGDEGVRRVGAELEHQGKDHELGWVVCGSNVSLRCMVLQAETG